MDLKEHIESLLQRKPFLQELIEDGLINITALARQVEKEIEDAGGQKVSTAAIVMAIRRMEPTYYFKVTHQLDKFLKELGDITVRTGLVSHTYRNTSSLYRCQQQLLDNAAKHNDVFCSFSQGIFETTIIISDSIESNLEQIFRKEQLLSAQHDLASITAKLPKENTEITGLYYFILKQLAWEGINIMEMISTTNEFTIAVDQADLEQAFSVMHRLRKINPAT
jgi:aspartokinase